VLLHVSEAEALFNPFHGGAEHLNFNALFVSYVNILRNKKTTLRNARHFLEKEKDIVHRVLKNSVIMPAD
jgi:hypothetical protein